MENNTNHQADAEKRYQIFISYRRDGGDAMAGRLADRFGALGYKVFYDVDSMRSGTFNTQILDAIAQCDDVLLVLPPNALDRCVNANDWVRQELAFALEHNKNIIPIIMRGFSFPQSLPADIDNVRNMEGVTATSEYFDAVVQRIESLLNSRKVIADAQATKTGEKEAFITSENANAAPLLKRAFMFLEDEDWGSADEYCERVLDIEPENAYAYLGKLMVEQRVGTQENLKDCSESFEDSNHYKKAVRFADEKLKTTLIGYIEQINTRNENARLDSIYNKAKSLVDGNQEKTWMDDNVFCYERAIKMFESISGWKDADDQIIACRKKIEEIKAKGKDERLEREKAEEKLKKQMAIILCLIAAAVVLGSILTYTF